MEKLRLNFIPYKTYNAVTILSDAGVIDRRVVISDA